MHRFAKLLPIIIIFLMVSCQKDKELIQNHPIKNYLHVSHTRSESGNRMDSVVEKIDYGVFDMLWLGGDLVYNTTETVENIAYVDSVFDLGNSNTLWSVGNHDTFADPELIPSFTNRPLYYSYCKNGITIIVLNTQDSLSSIIGDQKKYLDNVLDTIQDSKYLVLLHHKLIWMYDNPDLEGQIAAVSNGMFGECYYCLNVNNFYTDIYPQLVEIYQKGIQVICIGGDIGVKKSEFETITPEGIHFLASGIEEGNPDNKALLFHHDIDLNELSWEYKLITDL